MNKEEYKDFYNEQSFKNKLQKFAKTAGIQVVYSALLLYYMMKDPSVPLRAKVIIAAALGYFILPTDAIPDLAPLVGYSDDLGVLIFALSQISDSITTELQEKAKSQLRSWFNDFDEEKLDEIHAKIF
ncbi:YkvA family protein [uncultured Sunxiuqinia sp.]|uniref:YkvA family protein n=1 Tax=uncultured Sunxiuqinia sp. TaxID=1573825 RepID=UPI002AA623B6|nr:YkvA family protein [uncultured Sunxiuqinia sp.]